MSSSMAYSAAIGLEDPSHGRGRRIGEHRVDQEACCPLLLHRRARAYRAEPLVLRARPIARPPLADQRARDRRPRPLIEFDERHPVLASMLDPRQETGCPSSVQVFMCNQTRRPGRRSSPAPAEAC